MAEENKNQLTLEGFRDFFRKDILPAMEARFATREDFNRFVNALEARFATREDFNRFVNALFKNLVTKDDIKGLASREELVKFKGEILAGQENILKRIEDFEIDSGAHTLLYDRQKDQIDEHEKRLGQLDGKLSMS